MNVPGWCSGEYEGLGVGAHVHTARHSWLLEKSVASRVHNHTTVVPGTPRDSAMGVLP